MRSGWRVDFDRINLDIVFADAVPNLGLRIATVVVDSIGDDEKGLAGVLRLLHYVQREIDGVEQHGATATRPKEREAGLKLLDIARERLNQFHRIAELHEKELIIGAGGLEELSDREPRLLER